MMAERELGPVDEQPEVRQAIASVQAAEATCRRAGEALVQARIDAGRAYTETRASLPTRAWSAVQGWQARLDLPELERAFAQAQLELERAQQALAAARVTARAQLEPLVRARLRPVLEARAQALERVLAADAAVAAVVAEIGHTGLVPLPACPCAPVLGGAQAAVAGAAEWLDPPPPAGLPADHVLVRCVRPFRVLPSGEVDQIPQNIGLIGAAGAPILPLESCAVTARAAAVLIERGFATRIPAAG